MLFPLTIYLLAYVPNRVQQRFNEPAHEIMALFVFHRGVRMAKRLALPTSDHGVAGSNPAGGEILPEPKRRFIAQSLSCSPFHRLEMTEILLKGGKILTHPSIVFPRLVLQMRMHSRPVGLDVRFLVGPFVCLHTSVQTAKTLVLSLRWSPV